MGKVLQQNYQNYTKTYLVQTRSKSKAKNARPSDTCTPLHAKAVGKVRREIKPIIIDDDDEPIIIDLDTKVGIETQMQDATVAKGSDSSVWQSNKNVLYPEPIVRPLPKPPELIDKTVEPKQSTKSTSYLDFEENSPHQEGIISETYINLDQTYFERPQELIDFVNTTKLVQKYLPREMDIDKILDVIKRKVLKDTHLPLTIMEIQPDYLTSPYFKDIYRYLTQNILPRKRHARQR